MTLKGQKMPKALEIFPAQSATYAVIVVALLLLVTTAAINIMVLVESKWVVFVLAFMLGLVAAGWLQAFND